MIRIFISYSRHDKAVAEYIGAEKILQGELSGWVQEMQDMLAELRAKQMEEAKGSEGS